MEDIMQQNQELNSNFQTLHDKYQLLAEDNNSKKKEIDALSRQISELTKYYETTIISLTSQKEPVVRVEAVHDLERVRLDACSKVRKEFNDTFQLHKKELEDLRKDHLKIKLELQETVKKNKLEINLKNDEIKENSRKYSIQEDILRSRIIDLESCVKEELSSAEKIQMGKRQIRELEEKVKTLQDENLEITRLKENLNLDRIREERSYKMRISEITSECKGLEGELCSLKQEISKLKQEIQDEKKEKEEQRTKNLESSQEIDKLKNMYSQRVHEYNIEVNQLKAIQVQDKSKDEAKIREENLKNSKLENILKKKEEILQSLKEELIVKDQEADRRVKEIREEIGENIGKLEFEKKDLEQEISRLNVKLIDLDNQHNLIRKDLENENLSLKESLRKLMVEKDSLTNENTALASDREKFLKESSTLAATYQALREKYDTLSQESENYKNQVGHLSERVSNLMISQNHLKDVNSSSTEALHKEKEAYDHQMERIKTQFMQERMQYKDALKDYSNEICILKEKNDKIKETMDLQKDAYLSKVHDLKKIIKKLESESDSLKNAKDSQASELQEIKNKQSTFFQFLQTELANPIV